MPLKKIVFYLKSALILSVILATAMLIIYEYINFKTNIAKTVNTHHAYTKSIVNGYFDYIKEFVHF